MKRFAQRTPGVLLLTLTLLLLATACTRPRSEGERYEVMVLADSTRHAALSPVLDSLFADQWMTLMPESRLAWRWADPAQLDLYLSRRNLLIAVDGPAEGPVGRFLENLLGAGVQDRIRKEEAFLFRKPEAFARDQLLLILAAPTPESFQRQARERTAEVRTQFLEHEQAAEREGYRSTRLQKALEDSLALACGFRLSIPPDWFVVQGVEQPPFIRLRRLNPDRWITVHWSEGPDSLRLTEEGLRSVRVRLGRLFWDKDFPEAGHSRFSTVRINGLEATLLEGIWGTDAYVGGGPFLLYAVHVPGAAGLPQGRTFYIDAAVLNPGGPKSPFLHQLSQLVATFAGTDAEGKAIGPLQPEELEE